MKKSRSSVLVLLAALSIGYVIYSLWCPYPKVWNQLAVGMNQGEVAYMMEGHDAQLISLKEKQQMWQIRRLGGKFVISISFNEERIDALHCRYYSVLSDRIFRARNK